MSERAFDRLLLVLLLLVCAALLYLDWMRHQEVEGLHMRVDKLDPPGFLTPRPAAPAVAAEPVAPPADPVPGSMVDGAPAPEQTAAPEVHPLIRSVLLARTDHELGEAAWTSPEERTEE